MSFILADSLILIKYAQNYTLIEFSSISRRIRKFKRVREKITWMERQSKKSRARSDLFTYLHYFVNEPERAK